MSYKSVHSLFPCFFFLWFLLWNFNFFEWKNTTYLVIINLLQIIISRYLLLHVICSKQKNSFYFLLSSTITIFDEIWVLYPYNVLYCFSLFCFFLFLILKSHEYIARIYALNPSRRLLINLAFIYLFHDVLTRKMNENENYIAQLYQFDFFDSEYKIFINRRWWRRGKNKTVSIRAYFNIFTSGLVCVCVCVCVPVSEGRCDIFSGDLQCSK